MTHINPTDRLLKELRWERLIRYQVIEIFAHWEGRLTTNHLCERFDIGRQQASKDIKRYLQDIAPGNLIYDSHIKGYTASNDFVPRVTRGEPDEYLSLLHEAPHLTSLDATPNNVATEVLKAPVRPIDRDIIRTLTYACREQRRVEVEYMSLSDPADDIRVICPHTLVYNGVRWHVRAYCEKNRGFRDFVLSRFRGKPEAFDSAEMGIDDDRAWQTMVTAVIEPDPRLTPHQKQVIANDYSMDNGRLALTCRGPLLQYQLRLMQLDTNVLRGRPSAQQIIIANFDEISDWVY